MTGCQNAIVPCAWIYRSVLCCVSAKRTELFKQHSASSPDWPFPVTTVTQNLICWSAAALCMLWAMFTILQVAMCAKVVRSELLNFSIETMSTTNTLERAYTDTVRLETTTHAPWTLLAHCLQQVCEDRSCMNGSAYRHDTKKECQLIHWGMQVSPHQLQDNKAGQALLNKSKSLQHIDAAHDWCASCRNPQPMHSNMWKENRVTSSASSSSTRW